MAYVAGDFSPSVMDSIIVKEAEMFATSRQTELAQPIVAGAAILANQDISTEGYDFAGEDCLKVRITNLRGSVTFASDKTIACTVATSAKAATDKKELTKDILINPVRFTVDETMCNNKFSFTDVMAAQGLRAKAKIEQELTKLLLVTAGANCDAPTAAWVESATATLDTPNVQLTIPAASWKADLIADFTAIKTLADMPNAIIVTGRNFYNEKFLAEFKGAACCDNSQALVRQQEFDMFFDLKNVDAAFPATTFLIDRNALIFWSSPMHKESNTPEQVGGDTFKWTEKLPRLQYFANGTMNDIFIDVYAQRVCTTSGGTRYNSWNMEYIIRGVLDTNFPNVDSRKGILKFKKV